MTTSTLACPLGVTEQTLSALRDGLLERVERANLEHHVAGCAACQQRLADFDRVGWTMRSQREPDLRDRVWRGLQRRMEGANDAHGGPSSGGPSPLRPAVAAIAAVAAVLVVALFVVALAGHIRPGPGSGTTGVLSTATPLATASPSPTPTTPPGGLPAGWTAAAIPSGYLPDVAFAPSSSSASSRVLYSVVITTGGAAAVQVSHDGGATWQSVPSPTSNQDRCSISVDPSDAQDVVLICTPAASDGYTVLRSLDGAKSWTKPQLNVTGNCYAGQGWAGSTLLLAFEMCDGGSSQTQLIASVAKGSFKRLDSDGSLSGIPLQTSILRLTGHGSTYMVQMGQISSNPTQFADTLLVSNDSGSTWKSVTLSDGSQRVHLEGVGADGHEWVAAYESQPTQLALSTDDGQTWRKYPAPWANEMGPGELLVAPDGTVFVTDERAHFQSSIPDTVYIAGPDATSWRADVTMPQNSSLRALVWDANGHPTALWVLMASDSRGSAWYLVSHPL